MPNEVEFKTPHEWMRLTGVRLEEAGKWPETMSRESFVLAAAAFGDKIKRWPNPLFDERPEPDGVFVELLIDALRSEFGPEFGVGINAKTETWRKMARGIAVKLGIEDCIASTNGIRHIRMNTKVVND